jgi:hypothetical protein
MGIRRNREKRLDPPARKLLKNSSIQARIRASRVFQSGFIPALRPVIPLRREDASG